MVSLNTCISDVLRKWQSDFSSLFNSINQSNEPGSENVQNTRENLNDNNEIFLHAYNGHISIFEVKDDAKWGKATDINNIPVADLTNDTSPRTSTIVQFIFYFGPLRSAIIFWEIRNKWLV